MMREKNYPSLSTTCSGCKKYCLLLINGQHLCSFWGPLRKPSGCKYYTSQKSETLKGKINLNVKYCKECSFFMPLKQFKNYNIRTDDTLNGICHKYSARQFNGAQRKACKNFNAILP